MTETIFLMAATCI